MQYLQKYENKKTTKMWFTVFYTILREECDGSDEKWFCIMKIHITLAFFDHAYTWKEGGEWVMWKDIAFWFDAF